MEEVTSEIPIQVTGTEESKKKGFKIQSKRIFLTYSRCPESWTKEFVRDKLVKEILIHKRGSEKYKTKVRAYVISEEKHQEKIGSGEYERGNKHYHCLLEAYEEFQILDEKQLDIDETHGNYQAVRDIFAVINYVKKHGNWIGEGYPGMENKERNILEAKTEEDAKMQLMNKMSVKDKLAFRDQMIERIERKTTIEEVITKAPLYAFQEVLMPFHKGAGFIKEGRPMGLVMYGESNSGKTTTAYRAAYELDHGLAVYRNPKEMLQQGKEQVILFDEMTKERFEENRDLLSLLVTDPYAKTESYFGNKKMEWPRKVLIATNEDVEKWEWNEATKSRFIVVKTYADGRYEYKRFKNGRLEIITKEELLA